MENINKLCPPEELMDYEEGESLMSSKMPSKKPEEDAYSQNFPDLPKPKGSLNFKNEVTAELNDTWDITTTPVEDLPKAPQASTSFKTPGAKVACQLTLVLDTTLIEYLIIDTNGYIKFMKNLILLMFNF